MGLSSLSLTNNGGPNLLTSAQTLATTDNKTYTLGNLTSLTSGGGNSRSPLNPPHHDVPGNALATGATTSFTIDTTPPTASIAPVSSPTKVPAGQLTFTFSEPVTGVALSSLSLTSNGGPNLLTSAQTLTTADNKTFTLGGLTSLTSGGGNFTLTSAPLESPIWSAIRWRAERPRASRSTSRRPPPPSFRLPAQTNVPAAQLAIAFNEPVTGVGLLVAVAIQQRRAQSADSAQKLTTTDNKTFTLGGLTSLTSGGGNFTLTLSPAKITDLVGNAMTTGAATSFAIDTTPPTAAIAPISSPTNVPADQLTLTFSEPVTGVGLSFLSLSNNGGPNLLTSDQTLTTTDNQTFTLGNLTPLTSGGGNFTLTLSPAGFNDLVGNAMTTGATAGFAIDTTPPAANISPVSSPASEPVGQLTITFSEPVTGVGYHPCR